MQLTHQSTWGWSWVDATPFRSTIWITCEYCDSEFIESKLDDTACKNCGAPLKEKLCKQ